MNTALLLDATVRSLGLGTPVAHGSLALVPIRVRSGERTPKAYFTLGEASERGVLALDEEDDGGRVPFLRARVLGAAPVLFVAGELLVGGRQNRIVTATVLAPARATTSIPVACVEHGRWSSRAAPVSGFGAFGSPTLRSARDQETVWSSVEDELESSGADSDTRSVGDAFKAQAGAVGDVVAALVPCLSKERTIGVAAIVGGRVLGADLFDRAGTLGRLAPALVAGYALEGLRSAGARAQREAVARLLFAGARARSRPSPTVGLGRDWRLEARGVRGSALEAGGRLVHVALFPCSHEPPHLEG